MTTYKRFTESSTTSTSFGLYSPDAGNVATVIGLLISNQTNSAGNVTLTYDGSQIASNLSLPVDTTISLCDNDFKMILEPGKTLSLSSSINVSVYLSLIESVNNIG